MMRAISLEPKSLLPRRRIAVLIVIAFAMIALGLTLAGEITLIRSGLHETADEFGVRLDLASEVPLGSIRVRSVVPGSLADQAAVRQGDLVNYDSPFELRRIHRVGDPFGLTVTSGGHSRHLDLTYRAAPQQIVSAEARALVWLNFLATVSAVLFAWLIIIRRRNDAGALCLGLMMIGLSVPTGYIPSWITVEPAEALILALAVLTDWSIMLALPLAYYLSVPEGDRRQSPLVWGAFAAAATLSTIADIAISFSHGLPIIGKPGFLFVPAMLGVMGGGIALMAHNYPRATPEQRNRIKIIAGALALYLGSSMLSLVDFFGWAPIAIGVAVKWGAMLLGIAAPAMLAYAVIRKGLFDFSFAINRTLVYGAVSLVLLCGFGLAEWAVHHLVPESWQQAGPVYSAGIALALFLAFHRIRDFVEHHIEQLFFRSWHRNENELARFLASVPHFEKPVALASATVNEFRRFSGGASAALYWRDEAGPLALLAGDGLHNGRSVDADDPALIQTKRTRKAVSGETPGSAIDTALLLPIFDHQSLHGFIALKPKPRSLGYRPDEIESLEAAATKVGNGMMSLQSEALRDQLHKAEASLAELRTALAAATT